VSVVNGAEVEVEVVLLGVEETAGAVVEGVVEMIETGTLIEDLEEILIVETNAFPDHRADAIRGNGRTEHLHCERQTHTSLVGVVGRDEITDGGLLEVCLRLQSVEHQTLALGHLQGVAIGRNLIRGLLLVDADLQVVRDRQLIETHTGDVVRMEGPEVQIGGTDVDDLHLPLLPRPLHHARAREEGHHRTQVAGHLPPEDVDETRPLFQDLGLYRRPDLPLDPNLELLQLQLPALLALLDLVVESGRIFQLHQTIKQRHELVRVVNVTNVG
jgi:hypothetical protein